MKIIFYSYAVERETRLSLLPGASSEIIPRDRPTDRPTGRCTTLRNERGRSMGLRRGLFYPVFPYFLPENKCMCMCVCVCMYTCCVNAPGRKPAGCQRTACERKGERARDMYKRRNNGLQNAPVALYTFAYRVPHSMCVATCERNPKPPTFLPSFLPPFLPSFPHPSSCVHRSRCAAFRPNLA